MMRFGRFNIVVDGQWGSCGKGLIAGYLAKKYCVDVASTNNLPNAGHTIIMEDEGKFVSKILPVSTFLNKYGQNVQSYIGPGAGFFTSRLLEELESCQAENLRIHPRAMVVQDHHAAHERSATKHIASTMQGSGAVQVERMMRGADVKLAEDHEKLAPFVVEDWLNEIHTKLPKSMWLHEGSQGFSLGMLHGSHYPYCTSRECTTAREMTDMGFAPQQVGDVYVVIRPYPIRVGNVVEDGKQVGYSGDVYPGQEELTWAGVKQMARYPDN
ncbi:MAG: adenylosuccinate synthetase [Candidatus Hodarchaeales archaeon]|jgi:adenylosuccinate synthase